MFTAHRSSTSKGFIAIDDITVKEGLCGAQSVYSKIIKGLMLTEKMNTTQWQFCFALFLASFPDACGFDNGLCNFANSASHRGQWIQKRATEEEVDHTYGTDHGE